MAGEVRDEFGGKAMVASVAVWPHKSGEVIVQPFNALLSTAELAEVRPVLGSAPSSRLLTPRRRLDCGRDAGRA